MKTNKIIIKDWKEKGIHRDLEELDEIVDIINPLVAQHELGRRDARILSYNKFCLKHQRNEKFLVLYDIYIVKRFFSKPILFLRKLKKFRRKKSKTEKLK